MMHYQRKSSIVLPNVLCVKPVQPQFRFRVSCIGDDADRIQRIGHTKQQSKVMGWAAVLPDVQY